jgi:diacylglycerol kinase family enzyme
MRLALVLNRAAGGFRRAPFATVQQTVCTALAEGGHQVDVFVVSRRELSRTLSALAARKDLDAVVIGGGDGTVLTAIVAGLGREIPIGILPLGTLNLFARDLGLDLDPIRAAHMLARAQPAAIDLAEVNGLPFAIWASLGMHPWFVRQRDHLQRDGMRKWRAMVLAGLRALRRYPMIEVSLDLEDGPTTVTTPMLFITNNAWRDETPPLSRESLDQGRLEIHVAHCRNRLSLIWLMIETLVGHWRRSSHIQTYRVPQFRVTSQKHRMMLSLDGEVTVLASPLLFKVRPGALSVLMPPKDQAP